MYILTKRKTKKIKEEKKTDQRLNSYSYQK